MASKRYPDKVLSELSQSAFFRPAPPPTDEFSHDEPATKTRGDTEAAPPSPVEAIAQAPDGSVATNVRTNERTNVRPRVRRKIRHTFDIFADQLRSIREIALEREAKTGDRVLLGELAQEALDMLIEKERTK